MQQQWTDAIILGVTIGVVAVALQQLLAGAGTALHIVTFLIAGIILCLMQIVLMYWRKRANRNK